MMRKFLALFASLIVSCSLFTKDTANIILAEELVFPDTENYDGLIRIGDNLVVLVNGGEFRELQMYASENDEEFTRFVLPQDPRCSPDRYHAYETLPDGHLQVWEWCLTEEGGINYLLTYDWNTRQFVELVGPLPLGSSGASWNPEQTKAIGYLDSKFATKTLYWIYPERFEPLDLEIIDGTRSWNLKDDFPKFIADDTGNTGTTGRAAWSPDGESIAFFASSEAIGKTGFDRFGVEHKLYLMNPATLQPSAVADSIFSPFLLFWSPDSTHIAFISKYGFWKEYGIWLYSTKDDSITMISEGRFQEVIWRSNSSVIAIRCESIDVCNQIMEYDLTDITN